MKRGYILTVDQSDAGSVGIFSRWTNQTHEAWVYSHCGPIRRTVWVYSHGGPIRRRKCTLPPTAKLPTVGQTLHISFPLDEMIQSIVPATLNTVTVLRFKSGTRTPKKAK
eukprot:1194768-Prorocentrum_minimum.AAC.1